VWGFAGPSGSSWRRSSHEKFDYEIELAVCSAPVHIPGLVHDLGDGVPGLAQICGGSVEATLTVGAQQTERDARAHQPECGVRRASRAMSQLFGGEPTAAQVIRKAKLDRGPDRLTFPVAGYQIIDPLEVLGAGHRR